MTGDADDGAEDDAEDDAEDELHTAVGTRLEQAEGRYTRQRRALVDVLVGARQPLTVEEIHALAPGVPQSSLYRNLAVLEETGVVHRFTGHGDFARFELAEELTGHHHHFVCSNCGAMTDVELPGAVESRLEDALAELSRREGFTIAEHRLDIVGLCRSCA